MKKTDKILILIIVSLVLTSCVRDEEVIEEAIDLEEKPLEAREVLDLTMRALDERENYGLEYRSYYSIDSSNQEFGDLRLEKEDTIYHYQDGRGSFKTIVERLEDEEEKEKIVSHNGRVYLAYDSDMTSSDRETIYRAWKPISQGSYEGEIEGLVYFDSLEDFMEEKDFARLEIAENPMEDARELLEIYAHSTIYQLDKTFKEEEDYIFNFKSLEEAIDISFYIDREDFYIKSYEGVNGDIEFGGEVVKLEEYLDYPRDFFDSPYKL